MQEVLRLYPSAGFSRNILREFTFKDGTKLPAGEKPNDPFELSVIATRDRSIPLPIHYSANGGEL